MTEELGMEDMKNGVRRLTQPTSELHKEAS